MVKRLLLSISIIVPLGLFAQKNEILETLREKFPDENLAFTNFTSTYEYFWDKNTNSLKVLQTDEVDLIALRTGFRNVWPIFYNDQIEVTGFKLKNSSGRKQGYEKFCGHQEQGGIFHSDAKLCTYSFYSGSAGEKLKLITKTEYKDSRYLTKIPLQEYIPGIKRVVEIKWPKWVEVEALGFHLEEKDILISKDMVGDNMVSRYEWKWPSATSNEMNKPHYSHFVPHLILLTKSYSRPNNLETTLLKETKDLYKWYSELTDGMKNSDDSLRLLVKELTQGQSQVDKISSIYYWVQDHIQYIAFEDGIMGFQPEDSHEVYYKRYGDCKGMANLLKSMLTIAGFDARLTWLGTTSLPYTYDIPSLAVDNHMICTVIRDEDMIVLDATVKFNEINYHPYHIQGKQIMIENGESYIIETIPIEDSNSNYERFELNSEIKEGNLIGEGTLKFDGDAKQFFLNALHNIDKSDKDKFVRSVVAIDANRDDFQANISSPSRQGTLEIKVNQNMTDKVNIYGNEIYVDLEFRMEFVSSKVDNSRKAPYNFGRRRLIESIIKLKIPEGYKVLTLPDSMNIVSDGFKFNLKFEQKDDGIEYFKQIEITEPILRPSEFKAWNKSIDQLRIFYNTPIAFIKNDE